MASSLKSDIMVNPCDLFTSISPTAGTVPYTTQIPELGVRAVTGDGREFRFVSAGAVALVPGKLQQASAQIANHQNLAPTANASSGATSITVTLGATAATANYYSGGWALITTSTGAGYQYQISGHPAADSAATLTLTLGDALLTSIVAASTKVDLIANPYSGVIVNPATASSFPIGVAINATPATYYGWVQVKGVTNVLADGAVTVGTALVASNATAGAVEALTGVQAPVGIAVTDISTTEYGAVNINL